MQFELNEALILEVGCCYSRMDTVECSHLTTQSVHLQTTNFCVRFCVKHGKMDSKSKRQSYKI